MWDVLPIAGLVKVLHASASAVLLANGGLLALTSLRNGHLSDRARGNVDEALYKLPVCKLTEDQKVVRIGILINQNKAFLSRYKMTGLAFVFAMLSFLLFGPPAIIGYNTRHLTATYVCGILGLAGCIFFVIALCLLITEFLRGIRTLKTTTRY